MIDEAPPGPGVADCSGAVDLAAVLVLALAGCDVPIELVHARTGKRTRAEPVAALYEQGRISHCPEGARFNALDEELMALGSETTTHSPDRADALVWALTALLITGRAEPSLRRL